MFDSDGKKSGDAILFYRFFLKWTQTGTDRAGIFPVLPGIQPDQRDHGGRYFPWDFYENRTGKIQILDGQFIFCHVVWRMADCSTCQKFL